jgi:hypothetical protein
MRYLAVGLLLFVFYPSGALADFSGLVISVLDGDTIEVLHNTQPEWRCEPGIAHTSVSHNS